MTRNMLLHAGRICRSWQSLTDPGRGAFSLLHQDVRNTCVQAVVNAWMPCLMRP